MDIASLNAGVWCFKQLGSDTGWCPEGAAARERLDKGKMGLHVIFDISCFELYEIANC